MCGCVPTDSLMCDNNGVVPDGNILQLQCFTSGRSCMTNAKIMNILT